MPGIVLVLVWLACPGEAYAYLDPASGSMALQAIVGGLLGGLYLVKRFWRRLWGRGGRGPEDAEAGSERPGPDGGRE